MPNTNTALDLVATDVLNGVTVIRDTELTVAIWGGMGSYMDWLMSTEDAYRKTGEIFCEWARNNGIDPHFYSEEKECFSFYRAVEQAVSEGKSYVITENLS